MLFTCFQFPGTELWLEMLYVIETKGYVYRSTPLEYQINHCSMIYMIILKMWYRNLAHFVRCVLIRCEKKKNCETIQNRVFNQWGWFVVLSVLKKRRRKSKYWVYPILRLLKEKGEFHLLIKEFGLSRNTFQNDCY